MTARVLIATDLDRTLIYSRAAAGDCAAADMVAVEYLDGRAISFMTKKGRALLTQLACEHVVVPVTTRTPEQLARVQLPSAPFRYAIAANGGVLLVDGEPDAGWTATVRAAVAVVAPLQDALTELTRSCDAAWAKPPRVAADLFCYAVVDRAAMPAEALAELTAWGQQCGWAVSLQGRKLYVVPGPLTKSAAVREVARRAGTTAMLAAGDSLLDIDMLATADRGIHPGHGEIHASEWSLPSVDALSSTGIRAGEDVLAWLIRQVEPSAAGAGRSFDSAYRSREA